LSEEKSARGILVAMDLSPESLAAAELAVEVAAALGSEIEGLFVEERELLELGGHPLAFQVDVFGARARPVERVRLERELRAQAARARALLAKAASRRGISWSFRVVRGTVMEEIRTASISAETLTLGRVGWSHAPGRGLGRTTRSMLVEGEHGVLVPGRRPGTVGPVIACYDGSPAGDRVLAAAIRLAGRAGARLRVAVVASDEAELDALREEAESRVAASELAAEFEPLVVRRPSDLVASLGRRPCGLLVLPAGALRRGDDLVSLVSDLDCPLFVMR
jgi:nucleotide-binding universal stress UspA family protein